MLHVARRFLKPTSGRVCAAGKCRCAAHLGSVAVFKFARTPPTYPPPQNLSSTPLAPAAQNGSHVARPRRLCGRVGFCGWHKGPWTRDSLSRDEPGSNPHLVFSGLCGRCRWSAPLRAEKVGKNAPALQGHLAPSPGCATLPCKSERGCAPQWSSVIRRTTGQSRRRGATQTTSTAGLARLSHLLIPPPEHQSGTATRPCNRTLRYFNGLAVTHPATRPPTKRLVER
jgi:hypothetical protein